MTSESLRLFVAVDPPRAQLLAIEEAIAPLRAALPAARWAPVANQHLTLKFLGATPAENVEGVAEACARAASRPAPSRVVLGDLGAFPSRRRARVVWVGVHDSDRLLIRLAARLDKNMERLGYRTEKRPFKPHLTLARLKVPVPVKDALGAASLPDLDPFEVTEIVLYRSRLSPRGATYEILQSFPLAAAR